MIFTSKTKETDIEIALGEGEGIDTGIGFFDHMLTAFAFHSGIKLACKVRGDLHVDAHHTVEDTGLLLGGALLESLGNREGIERFGNAYVPMDEALAFAAIDISGRPFLSFEGNLHGMLGAYDASLTQEFFRAFAMRGGFTLHLNVSGENVHHMTEALYKAAGRAYKLASAVTGEGVRSTKGVL